MSDIKSALKTAGVEAEPFVLHGQKNCLTITIEKKSAMESWRKLRSVSEKTGYYPVFPANGRDFEESFDTMESFVPLAEPQPASASQERDYTAIADANERRNAIRQDMLKEYDMTDATPEQLNKPVAKAQMEAAIRRKANPLVLASLGELFNLPEYQELLDEEELLGPTGPSLNEMIAQQIENVEQMVQMRADRPKRYLHWDALKKFEAESLSQFCKVGKRPSLACLVGAGENLDVEKWIDLKNAEGKADIGNFTKEKFPAAKAPTSWQLLLLPVEKPWHVPAILRLGNWNENPPAHVHVAMLKRWHERFGAEVVTIGRDRMYLEVKKPVSTKDAALQLASEQFAYCPDTVLQGGDGTISGLAIDLIDQKVWQFWWD